MNEREVASLRCQVNHLCGQYESLVSLTGTILATLSVERNKEEKIAELACFMVTWEEHYKDYTKAYSSVIDGNIEAASNTGVIREILEQHYTMADCCAHCMHNNKGVCTQFGHVPDNTFTCDNFEK